jgi:hypothetical protein
MPSDAAPPAFDGGRDGAPHAAHHERDANTIDDAEDSSVDPKYVGIAWFQDP